MVVAVVMTWPLALHLGTRLPATPADPALQRWQVAWAGPQPKGGIPASPTDGMLQAWQIAWDGHALRSDPAHFWDSNTFWPLPKSLAFSDALVGYGPAGLIGSGIHAAIARYDLLLIFSFALAAFGAFALARVLGLPTAGAALAGAAFAYTPWRVAQLGHLHVLSSGGIPLALAMLVHGYRRSSARWIAGGWVVAAWQLSLGFTLGLQLLYVLLVLAGVTAFVVWRRRVRPPRRVVLATVGGGLVLVATAAILARPYLQVLHDYPEAKRSLGDVARFSPPLAGLLAAPRHDVVWGALTSRPRSLLNWPEEQTIFPGLLVVLLAAWCLVRGRRVLPGRLVVVLAGTVVVTAVLALGVGPGSWMPYRLLYDFAPGWKGVRTPDRLFTLTSLALALLAGGGLTAALASARPRWRGAIAGAAVLVVLAEGLGAPPLLRPPLPVNARLRPPVFFLPSYDVVDSIYMLWSVDGFPSIVDGTSGFRPRYMDAVRELSLRFPGPHTVAEFRRIGVRTLVVDRRLTGQTGWAAVPPRTVKGLPVQRTEAGPWVIYRLPAKG